MNLRPCISCTGRWPKQWARELSKVAKVTRVYCRPLRISAWSFQLPCRRRPHTWPVPDAVAHCPSPTITPSHPIHPPTCQVVWTRGYLRCYRSADRMAQCPHPIFTESKMMPRVVPRGPFLELTILKFVHISWMPMDLHAISLEKLLIIRNWKKKKII